MTRDVRCRHCGDLIVEDTPGRWMHVRRRYYEARCHPPRRRVLTGPTYAEPVEPPPGRPKA